jgi:fermentation-respiration switch protein FrsA (DUF1100 family)
LALAAACYVGVVIVLMLLENKLLFFPIRASDEWWEPPNLRVQDVEVQSADGSRIHAWWCPPESWKPAQGATLHCHGNAGNISHRGGSIASWQQALNQAVLIFDYPGYGRSTGKPSETGCYAAADAAYDWLRQVAKVPPEGILLYGVSLGGGVAVEMASRRPHRALVLVNTFTSIPDMAQKQYPWLPARWLVRNRFDNLAKIGQCPRPIFIAHGTLDGLIPLAQGERLFAAAPEPKRFLAMEGCDHDHTGSPEFYTLLRRFLVDADGKSPRQTTIDISEN